MPIFSTGEAVICIAMKKINGDNESFMNKAAIEIGGKYTVAAFYPSINGDHRVKIEGRNFTHLASNFISVDQAIDNPTYSQEELYRKPIIVGRRMRKQRKMLKKESRDE